MLPGVDRDSLAPGWAPLVDAFIGSPPGRALAAFLDQRRAAGAVIYPPVPLQALELTPFADVRAVILGQDPYHGAGQAHGLAFSVADGVRPPPSLRNVFAELQRDCGCPPPAGGSLQRWAHQGVLLLNAVLTVEDGAPGSHAGRGWEALTDSIVAALARDARPKAFLLWGAQAQVKAALIGAAGGVIGGPHGGQRPGLRCEPHLVLQSNHPSPLSARRPPLPFLGCGHFSQANAFLARHGRGRIDWCLPRTVGD